MTQITVILLGAGVMAGLVGLLLKRRHWLFTVAMLLAWSLSSVLVACGTYSYWYHHRRLPEPVDRSLFHGIDYRRVVRNEPRPLVIHAVRIDLTAPGIGFLVTPSDPSGGRTLSAQTTSQFLSRFGVQLAVNGGPFSPFYANGPLSYYPRAGDPVDPTGLVISNGNRYFENALDRPTLFLSADNKVSIESPEWEIQNAITGFKAILKEGVLVSGLANGHNLKPSPRTAIAIDESGDYLMLFVIDGRQPKYSEGVTLRELAEIIVEYGGHTAVNMDGGGSSTLVWQVPSGQPEVLNSPIHGRVPPGIERPVATHLGVYAIPLQCAE